MGNYRFKLSDMMPNAWFYKLRDMNNKNPTKKKLPPSSTQKPRKSFYHTTESITENQFHGSSKNLKAFDAYFPSDPPRKSLKNRTRRKSIYKPSPKKNTLSFSANCICREPENPVWLKPGHLHDHFESPVNFHTSPEHDFLDTPSSEFGCSDSFYVSHESWSNSCLRSSANDIIFDMDKTSYNTTKGKMSAESKLIAELGLKPILTKPANRNHEEEYPNFKNSSEKKLQSTKSARTFSSSPATRKSVSRSRGVKVNKITSRNKETRGRKSVNDEKKGMFYTDSFAIVKASLDPEQDFRDSMMEMIVEKNIKASKDLEDLLACYLSLNSNQYHDLIINAFEQIWFDMPKL